MSPGPRRVVITGLGCITAIGSTVDTFREALFAGRRGLSPLVLATGEHLSFTSAAQVEGFDAAALLPSAALVTTDRSAQFALAAAQQAVDSAALLPHYAPDRIGIVMGCAVGGRTVDEPAVVKLFRDNGRVHPLTIPRVMASSGASHLSMHFGITGPALNFSTACASSAHAIGHAFHLVRHGMVDAALGGGHEAALTYGFLKAWEAMRVVSPAGCKPFAADRDGMTLGEGAAILIFEEREQALARGARIFAEICGFGMSSDASHITQPKSSGAASAMRLALIDAELTPDDIGYINAHGTGTVANDTMEAEAIREVFGARAAHIPVSSTKGMHGHAIGASGAIEALATVLALAAQRIPPNAGITTPDPALGLDIPVDARAANATAALSNSFAFGGLNAVLAFRAAY